MGAGIYYFKGLIILAEIPEIVLIIKYKIVTLNYALNFLHELILIDNFFTSISTTKIINNFKLIFI